jgi:hypothetical protein
MTDLSPLRIDNDAARQLTFGIGNVLKTKLGSESPLPSNLQRLMLALAEAD